MQLRLMYAIAYGRAWSGVPVEILSTLDRIHVPRRCSTQHQRCGVCLSAAAPTSLPEQHAVAAMLDGVDAAIESAREERHSLNALKQSTGEALLTERVRTSGPCR